MAAGGRAINHRATELPESAGRWWQPVPWTGCFVALGLWLRFFHYLRDPSVWHDEAALVLNVLGKGFADLFGPLFFAEAAPPLFLWVEKLCSLLLGDGTYALRLVPFLASCGALLLLVQVARRLLRPGAVPWAVLLLACSDNLLWHACEAKPYSVEIFCAAVLLAVYAFTRDRPLGRQLLVYALLAPPIIFLAYPGCFLCGGLLVALLPAVWRSRQPRLWLQYGLLVAVVGGSFLALLLGPIHAQRCPEMTNCWLDQFAPWDRPWKVPVWTVAQTFEVGRYCCRPTGQALLVLAGLGAWLLWRRGQRAWVALLLTPLGLALAASYLKAYPYGGTRVLAYTTPALVLLMGEGAAAALAWIAARSRPGLLLLLGLLLAPPAWAFYHAVVPWDRADCYGASAYVLAHRRPTDRVASNHWEYFYYFRGLGPALVPLSGLQPQGENRLWLVVSGVERPEREQLARAVLTPGWELVEQREFARTTVFLLRPPSPPSLTHVPGNRTASGEKHNGSSSG